MAQAPTSDQIRDRIDSGWTGEKIGFPDPAAAPLGTDDEAAGQPPTVAERRMEAKAQPHYTEKLPLNGPLLYVLALSGLATITVLLAAFA